VKALTIRQPWASLIALGVKRIETRSWSTQYRGPLAIHAGKAWPVPVAEWQVPADRSNTVGAPCVERLVNPADPVSRRWEMLHTPLGAVVAVADLVDVVPMVDDYEDVCHAYEGPAALEITPNGTLLLYPEWGGGLDDDEITDVSDQRPYGDFTPGRFAWLLDNVRPLDPPVPAKGRQGLWTLDGES
jgi:hypothetical protein